jgi:glycosyltransferase involved in cell wall biosynthesis
MAQDPLHVLWIEPSFPGRMGAVADWLVRRRGYRASFYCHTVEPRPAYPATAGIPKSTGTGKGKEPEVQVQTFGVGGVAREASVAWSRALERSLCYAYGCWEVLEQRRPRPIDLIVGRSSDLGSSLFAPVYWPAAPVVNFLDYYYHPHQYDLADEAGPETPPAYFQWRRSMAAVDLLDLEQAALGWTATRWQQQLFPEEYRNGLLVLHDGIDTRRFAPSACHQGARGPALRSIAGKTIPDDTKVVSFVARSLERLRGFDRFVTLANSLLRARPDVFCVVVGDPIVRRGLDVVFHNRDYPAHLFGKQSPADPDRLWLLGAASPTVVAEVLAASDLHIAPSRRYPIARSLLEAMAAGCVVLASDTEPHQEIISSGKNGLLLDGRDTDGFLQAALAVLDDPAAYRPLGDAASALVHERYAQDVCLPQLAEQFSALVAARGKRP